MYTARFIFLLTLMILIFGSMGIVIIRDRREKKKQYEELTDDEIAPDEIYEEKLGKDTIWLSNHEREAFNSLTIKQRRKLMSRQRALINQGEIVLVDHPDGGKRMITRLEAIQKGVIK